MGDNNEKAPMSPRHTHGFSFDGLQAGMTSAMNDRAPGVNEGVDRRRNSIGENSQVTMDRGGGNTFNLHGAVQGPLIVFGAREEDFFMFGRPDSRARKRSQSQESGGSDDGRGRGEKTDSGGSAAPFECGAKSHENSGDPVTRAAKRTRGNTRDQN